jgi:hypothetical protein
MQPGGRARDAASIHDGNESAQMAEVHAALYKTRINYETTNSLDT